MKILLIFTGGTISMVRNPETGALRPADTQTFRKFVPELEAGEAQIDMLPFDPLIDSSDVNPDNWAKMARAVYDHYDQYDAFVVLHGTDTMSYSASALSFMLDNLTKPVVFTGSQLPVGVLRSDAKENLLTAIEIAAALDENGQAMVPEVCVFFENKLFRANRTTKQNAEHFEAFASHNYPALAKAGVHINYRPHLILKRATGAPLRLRVNTDRHVAVLKLFPGITEELVNSVLSTPGLRGVVLETYGSGNAPSYDWLYRQLKAAIDRGIIIVNKTQCSTGSVEMGRYEVSLPLLKAGVLSGYDITTEALLAKMMYLFGEYGDDTPEIRRLLQTSICGEITVQNF
ncbi:MAG: asparaginase [Paludibacteraceae bacterium]|nr:asparaginase [Paludibacteraceae bacterium]